MYYKISLRDLIDFNGDYFTYYRINVVDENDLEWPWLHAVKFSDPPTRPMKLKVDLEDEDAGEFPDYVMGSIPLVTQRLRSAFESVNVQNIDYYSVEIEGADCFDSFPTYYAVNIIGKVAVADPAKSKGLEAFGQPGATLFDELVVKPNLSQEFQVFRMAEHLSTVVVSEKVKIFCEAVNVNTLRFTALQ